MIKVGIYGATGYTGIELVKILRAHKYVDIGFLTSETYAGQKFSEVFKFPLDTVLVPAAEADSAGVDCVFTCLPHTTAMNMIAKVYNPNLKVIDLSADFRFSDVSVYEKWYNVSHTKPELIGESAYGLPEYFREKIRSASIVGNPGCYPTSALLAMAPLLEAGLVDTNSDVIVDAKSGVSGAGRKGSLGNNFCEVDEDLQPYKVGRSHRHVGEIEYQASAFAGSERKVIFTPHLAPFVRGILSTVYLKVPGADKNEIRKLYEARYGEEPFVHLLPEGQTASVGWVRGNNGCVLSLHPIEGSDTFLVVSAIDNLLKGASGQAVQNMNLVFGFNETEGLTTVGGDIPGRVA